MRARAALHRSGSGVTRRGPQQALDEPAHAAGGERLELPRALRAPRGELRQHGRADRRGQPWRIGLRARRGLGAPQLARGRRLARRPRHLGQQPAPALRPQLVGEQRPHVVEERRGDERLALLVGRAPGQEQHLLRARDAGVEERALAVEHVLVQRQPQPRRRGEPAPGVVVEERLGHRPLRELARPGARTRRRRGSDARGSRAGRRAARPRSRRPGAPRPPPASPARPRGRPAAPGRAPRARAAPRPRSAAPPPRAPRRARRGRARRRGARAAPPTARPPRPPARPGTPPPPPPRRRRARRAAPPPAAPSAAASRAPVTSLRRTCASTSSAASGAPAMPGVRSHAEQVGGGAAGERRAGARQHPGAEPRAGERHAPRVADRDPVARRGPARTAPRCAAHEHRDLLRRDAVAHQLEHLGADDLRLGALAARLQQPHRAVGRALLARRPRTDRARGGGGRAVPARRSGRRARAARPPPRPERAPAPSRRCPPARGGRARRAARRRPRRRRAARACRPRRAARGVSSSKP